MNNAFDNTIQKSDRQINISLRFDGFDPCFNIKYYNFKIPPFHIQINNL